MHKRTFVSEEDYDKVCKKYDILLSCLEEVSKVCNKQRNKEIGDIIVRCLSRLKGSKNEFKLC